MVLGCCFFLFIFFVLRQKAENRAPDQCDDRAEIKKAFDCFDIDNSGALDKEEFRKVMTYVHAGSSDTALTDAEFEALFKKADKDASGVISFDEYYAWAHNHGPVGWPRSNSRDGREAAMRVKMDAIRAEESDCESDW